MNYANACVAFTFHIFFQLNSYKWISFSLRIYLFWSNYENVSLSGSASCNLPRNFSFLMSFRTHSVLFCRAYATKLLGTRRNKCWNRVSANARRFFFFFSLAAVQFEWIETSLVCRFQVFPTAFRPKPCVTVIYDLFYISFGTTFFLRHKMRCVHTSTHATIVKEEEFCGCLSFSVVAEPQALEQISTAGYVHLVCRRNCYSKLYFNENNKITTINK